MSDAAVLRDLERLRLRSLVEADLTAADALAGRMVTGHRYQRAGRPARAFQGCSGGSA